jgi:hypothetical protein
MMHQVDYQSTRMAMAERHQATEQRRMIREAKMAAKAARPERSGSRRVWPGALVALFRGRPWKHVSDQVAKSQLIVEAQGR